jgi:hypothetical protein
MILAHGLPFAGGCTIKAMNACKALLVATLLAAAARAAEVEPPPLALPLAPAKPSSPRWLHKAANGTLELRSSSRGAAVSLDGLELGTVPLKPVSVAPGRHEVKLTKDGYQTATRIVRIRAAHKAVLSIELKSARVAPPPLALPVAPPAVASGAAKKQPGAASATAPMIAEPSPSETLSAIIASPPAAGSPAARADPSPPPPPLVMAAPARPAVKTVPAAALAASTQPAVSSEPLTKKWWFWGGAAAAAAVLVAGVTYALPALYVERRDPGAACGGGPCVIVNK